MGRCKAAVAGGRRAKGKEKGAVVGEDAQLRPHLTSVRSSSGSWSQAQLVMGCVVLTQHALCYVASTL